MPYHVHTHVLTGNDFLSAIGTKLTALKSSPVPPPPSPVTLLKPIRWLIIISILLNTIWSRCGMGYREKRLCVHFTSLDLGADTKDTIEPLDSFPSNSTVVRQHLQRGFFIIRKSVTLSTNASVLNPSHLWVVHQK